MSSLLADFYLPKVAAARKRIESDPLVMQILDPAVDPTRLEMFLITWSASGVYMTEPVESWIQRAGERTLALSGLEDVGKLLVSHAHHEAGHHTMMIDDTRHLVARWNERKPKKLDANHILAQPPLPATRRYVDLHEQTILSETPYCQIAIEFEIERLSVELGPRLEAQFRSRLGEDIVGGLSFLREHIELDQGHTSFNRNLLERCLTKRPDSAADLGKTGALALDCYLDFLGDCLREADKRLTLLA